MAARAPVPAQPLPCRPVPARRAGPWAPGPEMPHRLTSLGVLLVLAGPLFAGCLGGAPGGPHAAEPGADALVDATGETVVLGKLDRIAVTSVALAEIIAELGHAHRLVAIPAWVESSSGCIEVPAALEDIDRVGKPHRITPEQLLATEPELVLDQPFPLAPNPVAPVLDPIGVATYTFDHSETFTGLYDTYVRVATILERVDPEAPAKAAALVQAHVERQAALAARLSGSDEHAKAATDRSDDGAAAPGPGAGSDAGGGADAGPDAAVDPAAGADARATPHKPATLFQFPAGLVGASGTSAALLMDTAGAMDIASARGLTGYRQLSAEVLQESDPERVLVTCTSHNAPELLLASPRWSETKAARIGPETVRVVDPSQLGIVGPRFLAAAEQVAAWLHPDAFGHIVANVTVRADDDDANTRSFALQVSATDGIARTLFLPAPRSAPIELSANEWSWTFDDADGAQPEVTLIDGVGRILTIKPLLPTETSA